MVVTRLKLRQMETKRKNTKSGEREGGGTNGGRLCNTTENEGDQGREKEITKGIRREGRGQWGERERKTDRETETETDRQTDRDTETERNYC